MAERILYPEFRDEFGATRYPFADAASLTSDTGQTIELDTFLDASLYPIGAVARVGLTKISVALQRVTLVLGDAAAAQRATAVFDPLWPPDTLTFADDYGRPAGVLVSSTIGLARFAAWPIGDHAFRKGAAEFAAACVIPTPETGVRGLRAGETATLAGDVWLVGEHGVVLRRADDCSVRVDIVGDPLFRRRLCEPMDLFEPPLFIQTINGCGPNEYGGYDLTVGDQSASATIVRINPTDDGLRIEAVGQTLRTK